jgi:hypothetical protein
MCPGKGTLVTLPLWTTVIFAKSHGERNASIVLSYALLFGAMAIACSLPSTPWNVHANTLLDLCGENLAE